MSLSVQKIPGKSAPCPLLPVIGIQVFDKYSNKCVCLFLSHSWAAFLKTWLPFMMLCGVFATFILTFNLQ